MGFAGLAIFLAGAFTDTPAVVVFGIVLMLIQLDRWRAADRSNDNERAK
jgi:hypothetical protein